MLEKPIEIFTGRKNCFLQYLDNAERCLANLQLEDCLVYIQIAAKFASEVHMGDHYSPELESLMYRFFERINLIYNIDNNGYTEESNNILHIATEIHEVGGHTRLLLNWIDGDKTFNNHILVTGINENNYPNVLLSNYDNKFKIHNLARFEGIKKIIEIRKLASQFKYIVLHIHPEDVVTYIALIGINKPIIILNHADHRFWVGRDICDLVLEIREEGKKTSNNKRLIPSTHQVNFPIPLKIPIKADKRQVREKLGISEQEIVILSIASKHKYVPMEDEGLKPAIIEIANKYPNVRFLFVGPEINDLYWRELKDVRNDNVFVVGEQTIVDEYYLAADLYLDSYPVSSLTSLLDAAKYGLALVSIEKNRGTFDIDDISLDSQFKVSSVKELKCRLKQLVENPEELINNKNKYTKKIQMDHLMVNRGNILKEIYEKASCNNKLKTTYEKIPFDLKTDVPLISLHFKNPSRLFQYTKVWAWYFEKFTKNEKSKFLMHLNHSYDKESQEYQMLLPKSLK